MLDRKTPPPFNRSTSFTLLQPSVVTLPNGVNIHFISGGKQDVVKVDFFFNAGRWQEQAWGVSYFTSKLLTKGTKTKTSFEIAQRFDLFGANIELIAGLDYVGVSLYALTKNLEPVLQLLLEVLTEANFPEKELQQSKSIYLQNLKVNNEKTSFQASKLIRKNIFSDVHPYGKELEEEDVIKLERGQLTDFYQTFFSDFQVIVSGKIDTDTQHLITTMVGALTSVKKKEAVHVVGTSGEYRQYVKKADSVQTSIRLGRKSILRTHADYADVLFLNHILGGFFGSRLMKNIREEKGLTYGIYSSLHAMKHDSYVVIGADVNSENRDLAFQEIRNELKRLRTTEIGADELDTARYHFIGSLQSEITTPFAHAEKLQSILWYGLHPQHYKRMIERINVIRTEELIGIASTYFNEDLFLEVAVG